MTASDIPARDGPPARPMTLLLAGDALIVAPWSHIADPDFVRLVAEIRAADISIVNLETVVHEFRGHAQADSGGDYMASPPSIAGELKWAGFDMASAANNHAFDYGSAGILETIEHAAGANLVLAGIGPDLAAARAPAFFEGCAGTVSLVSTAASFVPYGRASASRPDLGGRPGINPLTLTRSNTVTVSASVLSWLARLRRSGQPRTIAGEKGLRLLGIDFRLGSPGEYGRGKRVIEADRRGNLAAIRAAASYSRLTVVALHSHDQRPWLRRFAREAIDAGAAIVHVHGPHALRGIELHRGGLIFYGMGDFVYQPHLIERFPSDAYERQGLPDDATPADLVELSHRQGGLFRREVYEGFVTVLEHCGAGFTGVRLLPIDLQFDAADADRGRPRLAGPALGRKIIAEVSERSRPLGTRVRYDAERNEGIVELGFPVH